MLKLKTVYYLPFKMIRDVVPSANALCIGLRDFDGEVHEYLDGFKAVGYFAQSMPTTVTGLIPQLEYQAYNKEPNLDHIQKVDSLARPVADFLKEHLTDDVETIYVNCVLGETRSYGIAHAIADGLRRITMPTTIDVLPLGNHKRPEYAYTNTLLIGRGASIIRARMKEYK